jgi:hypothetical protein
VYNPLPIPTPAVTSVPTTWFRFPPLTSGDTGGWMYLNLSEGWPRAIQNWVTISMEAEGRYSTAFTAVPLGNGCSPAAANFTGTTANGNPIGPRP